MILSWKCSTIDRICLIYKQRYRDLIFYLFSIKFWNCSDSLVFLLFIFIVTSRQIPRRKRLDSINLFNLATFVLMSHNKTYIFINICPYLPCGLRVLWLLSKFPIITIFNYFTSNVLIYHHWVYFHASRIFTY